MVIPNSRQGSSKVLPCLDHPTSIVGQPWQMNLAGVNMRMVGSPKHHQILVAVP
uniref:Uncharacterized protein n=1 Tax=Kalanchoe fedtschenkoi TaxID=63787 RepID=A0A7N0UE76_KALFE